MSDPTTIANLLQQTLVSKTQSIKKAQKTLQQLQSDPNFLPHLLLIPKQASVPRDIRKAAALYTRRYANNRLIEKNQQKVNATAEMLLNSLSESSIELQLRRHLAKTLEKILQSDVNHVLRNVLNPLCVKLLEAARTQDDASINYEFIGFFTETLMSSLKHLSKQSNAFIQQTIIPFCQLSVRLFKIAQLMLQQGSKQKLMHTFRIFRLFSHAFKVCMKKMLLADLQTVKLLYHQTVISLLSTSFDIILPSNELNTHIIFYNPVADPQIIEIFHYIKADYVQGLGFLMRTVFIQFKDSKMVAAHALLNSPGMVPSLINALNQILSKLPCHKIKSPSLVKLMEQTINNLIFAIRNPFYYTQFHQYKQVIIHGCILKVLAFSPNDCDVFYDDPEQFINQLLQIIQMDSIQYLKTKDNQPLFSDSNEDIQQYSNLRTLAATLLSDCCKHIDGSLPQITNFSLSALRNQINSQFPKSILLFMISILRDEVVEKQQKGNQVIHVICSLLTNRNIPMEIKDPQATPLPIYEENIEYLMILLSTFRYLSKVPELDDTEISVINQAVYTILSKPDVSEALKISALDLTVSVCERQPKYECSYIQVLNQLCLKNEKDREKCLEALMNLLKYSTGGFDTMAESAIMTVKNLAGIVHSQASKQQPIQLVINKCWNIISDICQNPIYIPKLIPQIEQALMPLLPFIDGKRNLDFEEDIFMMMSSFIGKSKSVTQNQLIMFQIIPKLFYTQYEYRFGHAFQTLHIFMYYGSAILASAPQAIKAIIDMALYSMNTIKINDYSRTESENCEGVLVLQSLILSCGNSFSNENWIEVAKSLNSRLQNPPVKGRILGSNILATLALIVMLGYKAFSPEDCDVLLTKILQNTYCFVVRYSIKVVLVALAQILCLFNLPFVSNKFLYLLDTIITLQEAHQNKQVFGSKAKSNDEKQNREEYQDYSVAVTTMKNMITQLDQIEHLKSKITFIKQHNPALLQKTLTELPEKKVDFLKSLMNVSKVMNQNRTIFKIKR